MFTRPIWDELSSFRRSFDQLFDNMASYNRSRRDGNGFGFAPQIETGWTDESLNLRLVVPGVAEKDLKIAVQGNQLLIQGERNPREDLAKKGHAGWQLPYGKFERVVDLPKGLEVDKIKARLVDGILELRIPLAAAMKPRSVQVQIGSGDQRPSKSAAAA